MEELKLIFASNLIKLRQAKGLTQAGLGELISYSDKSISKWERGEAIPDAYVLKQLASIFGVTVDDLLADNSAWHSDAPDYSKKVEYSQMNIILTVFVSIVTLCFTEFILVWMLADSFHWLVLYLALPLCLIFLLVMNSVWYKGRRNFYIVSLLVASIILFIYLAPLSFGLNYLQLLLLLIPAEIIVYLSFHIRKKHKKKS